MTYFRALFPLLAVLLLAGGCKKDTTTTEEDPAVVNAQKQVDDNAIKAYIAAQHLTATRTASGLYYVKLDTAAATAPQGVAGKTAVVNYYGRLMKGTADGAKFDSSYDRGQPFSFVVGTREVIAGWDEAVALMRVGDGWRVLIPSYLAYGSADRSAIPANSVLIFYIKLEGVR